MKTQKASWLYVKRIVRQEALSEEDKEKIFKYWACITSRPTGDKKEVLKKRIGKKEYTTNVKHVLEKTPTEAYKEFTELHPEVSMK